MPKLVLKTVVGDYGFDDDTLVWAFSFKNVLDWYIFLKCIILGQNSNDSIFCFLVPYSTCISLHCVASALTDLFKIEYLHLIFVAFTWSLLKGLEFCRLVSNIADTLNQSSSLLFYFLLKAFFLVECLIMGNKLAPEPVNKSAKLVLVNSCFVGIWNLEFVSGFKYLCLSSCLQRSK